MSIDFYRLVAPINNNQWIVIDYYWLYWLQSIDRKPLIDNAGFYYTTGNPDISINCSVTQYCNINTLLSGNEVGINAAIFILFTHHNFKLYLEWSRDATQGYFAERRMQNGIVLNMQMKRENNLALFFFILWEQCHSAFCILQNTPAQDAILCWFALWRLSLFSTYPPRPPPHPPPPSLPPPTQTKSESL